jgi:pantoate--beta-alanine ligase
MQIITTIKEVQNQIDKLKKEKKIIGFVPTMGALHAGHISLINRANKDCDITVCSIFVNPTQFNDPKDFQKYPITLDSDREKLIKAKCDILFLPDVAEMYPKGFGNKGKLDFGFIAETLEGEFRPGHFDGMAQIVEKLLLAVTPHYLYMGQKDYQQAMICGELIRMRKLKTKLVLCPIRREADGLAMSSRNIRLDKSSRKKAAEISKMLKAIKRSIATARKGEAEVSIKDIEIKAQKRLAAFSEFKTEYIAIRNAKTLKPIKTFKADTPLVALVATWIGGVRLIDNMLI